ncbi:MAG: hypothetical protein JST67_11165 [Bacteroidetes bacterium]|nr:hypothetical protein [Bacteroidota bacterium]
MLITENIRLGRIVSGTSKGALFVALTTTASYFFNVYILKNYFQYPAIIPTLLGTALAFFIGFNNNQAYSRWWEARIIWGAIVNESRSLARQSIHYIDDNQAARKIVYRHIAFVYALKNYLRNTDENNYLNYLQDNEHEQITKSLNKYNALLSLQTTDLEECYAKGHIDGFKFMEINQTINNLCNEMGKSERIKNTVFPTTYTFYTRIFIFYFIVSVTIVLANLIGAYAILFGFLVGYVYHTSHVIGTTLLNPFEATPTCIPLDQISKNIEINLKEMLGETNLPEPIKNTDSDYIL